MHISVTWGFWSITFRLFRGNCGRFSGEMERKIRIQKAVLDDISRHRNHRNVQSMRENLVTLNPDGCGPSIDRRTAQITEESIIDCLDFDGGSALLLFHTDRVSSLMHLLCILYQLSARTELILAPRRNRNPSKPNPRSIPNPNQRIVEDPNHLPTLPAFPNSTIASQFLH